MRILFVAPPESPHSASHAEMLVAQGWEVHVVPCLEVDRVRGFPPACIIHRPWAERLEPIRLGGSIARVPDIGSIRPLIPGTPITRGEVDVSALVDAIYPNRSGWAWFLANLVDRLRPDLVHTYTMMQAGYLALAAKTILHDRFPMWIVTNGGSDIYHNQRFPEHARGIRAVLESCDFYMAGCHRDVALARVFGFGGTVLGVEQINGGFDLRTLRTLRQPGPTSARRVIAMKGYQGPLGRALAGLRAIEQCADVLRGFRIVVYAAADEVHDLARTVSVSTGIPVASLPRVPHDDVMRLHGRARVSIGLSLSDGVSISALEAMIMGSFPIQSNTSCLDEWVRDGETGLLVEPEDVDGIAAAIRRAVTDDELVDRAADANDDLTRARLDRADVGGHMVAMYERAIAETTLQRGS